MFNLFKNITIVGVIILASIMVVDIFPGIKSSIPNINLSNIFPSPTSIITPTKVVPTIDIKTVKSKCIDSAYSQVKEQYQGQKKPNDEWNNIINNLYRVCLARNGLTPEDLLSNPNESGNNYVIQNELPSAQQNNNSQINLDNIFEENEVKRKQECQDKLNKYTSCMIEYQNNLNNYYDCLARYSNNPNLNSSLLCFKPSNFCGFKPICF